MSRCVRTWIKLAPEYPFKENAATLLAVKLQKCFLDVT